jgi:hypothetical protein
VVELQPSDLDGTKSDLFISVYKAKVRNASCPAYDDAENV